ncbi:MAG: extracellular solute-binding protein [Thermoleophilia bacterium]|nr:extracellular solute-binding protein [Thermoleophilia bacterium]
MSRKRLAAALAVALACGAAALAGSGTGRGQAAARAAFPTGPVHLTMWWWGEQEAAGAKGWLADTVRLYEQKHPNVTIKTVLQTTDGLIPSFKAAAAAKKGPDLQYFWGGIWSVGDAWAGNTKPVSDYIPRSELRHYLNIREDTWNGKVWTAPWYVQPSFPVLYRKDVLAKAGIAPPRTWSQLLSACDKLNAKGIIPMAGGIKDGWFGGWLFSLIGAQNLRSLSDLLAAVSGEKKFTDPEFVAWWQRLHQMRDHKCWNNDINSLQLYQGQQKWAAGKAAMTITAGSDVKKFVGQVGVAKVGLMPMPKWANGPYAGKLGSTSQTVGITAWTKYPQVDADFIMFMHSPKRMKAWYKITGAFPADDRFDKSQITLPQQRLMFSLVTHGAPYLENFIPTELDSKANFGQSQLLLGGSANAEQAAATTERIAQRIRLTQRQTVANFKSWAASFH